MDKADEIRRARELMLEFLRLNGLRNTPERQALIETVCMTDGPFKPESLLTSMAEEKKFRVSRATVYNNLNLLESAGMVRKSCLNGQVRYEKAGSLKGKIRLICGGCGRITEMTDEKLRRQIEDMRKTRFTMTEWSLSIYGLCSKCSTALKRKQNKLNKKHKEKNENGKD